MNYLADWVSQLVLIILFAVILELLMPSRGFQKYVRLVIGLVLIVALLDPVIRLFQINPSDLIRGIQIEQTNPQMENQIDKQKTDIESAQASYIQEQVAVQLKEQVKEALNERYGLQINEIKVSAKELDGQELSLNQISLSLGPAEKSSADSQSKGQSVRPVEPVQEVSVQLEQSSQREKADISREAEKIRVFLADSWTIDKEIITIRLEGGDTHP